MDVLTKIIQLPMSEKNQLLTDAATEIALLRDKIRSLENQCDELRREARMAIASKESKSILPKRVA